MRTVYPFTLPRGYIGPDGTLHRDGTMRLATGKDELEPLRDPFVKGPDDPRLTMLVLARVVQRLGTIEYVTLHEIENLFAADLAFLQDFYSVVNFGDQTEFEALLRSAGRPRPDLVLPGSPAGPGGPAGTDVGTAADPAAVPPADVAAPAPGPGAAGDPELPAPITGRSEPTTAGPLGSRDEFGRAVRVLGPPTRRDAILEVAAAGGRG